MGLYQHLDKHHKNDEIYAEGDWVMTDPDGEPIASWGNQELSLGLVHNMVNEAYRQGQRKGEKQLAQIKLILGVRS